MESATLGGGCFWCLEAVYREVKGIEAVIPAYAGGHAENPTYEEVCTGRTGHAEVVRLEYDPEVISYGDLLDIYFTLHDPTTLDRQGNDIGPQYRSVIFHHSPEQEATAREKIRSVDASGMWGAPAVTRVEPLTTFHRAEAYHVNYFETHPENAYCAAVVAPKVAKMRKLLIGRLKAERE